MIKTILMNKKMRTFKTPEKGSHHILSLHVQKYSSMSAIPLIIHVDKLARIAHDIYFVGETRGVEKCHSARDSQAEAPSGAETSVSAPRCTP